jgi:S1-C subfamily serine protease
MSDEPRKRRWWRRKDDGPVALSRVCPSCQVAGPKRLAPGQVCPTCEAQQAWNAIGESGLKIDQAAIDEAVKRREGEAASEAWWRQFFVWAPVAFSLAVAAFAVWSVFVLLQPREIGPLQGLFDDLHSTTRHALWIGIGAFIVGIVALVRTRKNRHYRKAGVLIGHLLAITAGAGAIVIAAMHMLAVPSSFGGRYQTMPARDPSLGVTASVDRIIAATVVVLSPGGNGDARELAMGTGAIIGGDSQHAWIVTCSHVAMPYSAVGTWRHAKDAQPVWIQLSDGREGKATVKWAAPPPLDIAVIELPIANPPTPVPIAPNAGQLEPSSAVTFVPNPYRDGWLVHHGHLMRKEAHDTPAGRYELLITDLPVTHGDSGSGLFDDRGQLVGLNTWTKLEDGLAHGISLPSEAMHALADAVQHEQLERLDDMLPQATQE